MSLSDPAFWAGSDREAVLTQLRRDRPVSRQEEPPTVWSEGGRGYWAVLRHADVRHVSRTPGTFRSGAGTELFDLPLDVARSYSGMLNMDAPEHTLYRGLTKSAFSPRRVAQLEPDVRRRAGAIVDRVRERGACDFATDIADALPIEVTCDLLGVPASDRAEIVRLSRVSVPLGDAEYGTFDDAYAAARALIEYGKELRRRRLAEPLDDLTTVLAHAELDGTRLSDEDVGTYFELLVTAGIETTGSAASHGMIALCSHPAERRRWQEDFDALAATAVEEILRWATPVVHFRRTATADVTLAGQRIAAGDKVVVFYNSANRDEEVFAEPYRFDVGRRPNPHVAFGGGGPHTCLGGPLARLELRALFAEVLSELPDLELDGPPVLMHSMFFNGVKSLPCRFTPSPPRKA